MINPMLIGPIVDMGKSIIDRIFPDKEKQAQERAQAELALAQLNQDGTLKLLATQMSAIVAEAQSPDPWTSRSRPSFLYVMYVLILWSIPMGILSAFKPEIAAAITKGMTGYLAAIPEPLYVLFGTGYLGYTAARQFGKTKGTDK
jgi:hypothetical protein